MSEMVAKTPAAGSGRVVLKWATVALVATVWVSSLLFGLYILAFYMGAVFEGDLAVWNTGTLPDLYEQGEPAATAGIGVHFALGAIILILGSIQLVGWVRTRFPRFHRWVGRVYVGACFLTAVGGLTFIAVSGTLGGTVMNIGFGLYGLLMLISSVETYRHARAGRFEQHNLWSWRLYALAIGSWLYRMEYGFWFVAVGFVGTTKQFTGVVDWIMAFFFYVPNLILVEILWRARHKQKSTAVQAGASVVFLLATFVLLFGTYFFASQIWLPTILGVIGIEYIPPAFN